MLWSPRHEYQERFQRDPDVHVAVLSITACAQGLNLTSAALAVFAELYWVPGTVFQVMTTTTRHTHTHRQTTSGSSSVSLHSFASDAGGGGRQAPIAESVCWTVQAEDRIHRVGQTAAVVRYVYVVSDGTIDKQLWDALDRKMKVRHTAAREAAQATHRRREGRSMLLLPPPRLLLNQWVCVLLLVQVLSDTTGIGEASTQRGAWASLQARPHINGLDPSLYSPPKPLKQASTTH